MWLPRKLSSSSASSRLRYGFDLSAATTASKTLTRGLFSMISMVSRSTEFANLTICSSRIEGFSSKCRQQFRTQIIRRDEVVQHFRWSLRIGNGCQAGLLVPSGQRHARQLAENFVVFRQVNQNFDIFRCRHLQGPARSELHHVGGQLGSADLVNHARHSFIPRLPGCRVVSLPIRLRPGTPVRSPPESKSRVIRFGSSRRNSSRNVR